MNRRTFLKKLGAGAALCIVPVSAMPTEIPKAIAEKRIPAISGCVLQVFQNDKWVTLCGVTGIEYSSHVNTIIEELNSPRLAGIKTESRELIIDGLGPDFNGIDNVSGLSKASLFRLESDQVSYDFNAIVTLTTITLSSGRFLTFKIALEILNDIKTTEVERKTK